MSLANPCNPATAQWCALLQQQRVIAVIRAPHLDLGLAMAHAIAAGGIYLIEIAWNSHQPALLVEQLRAELPHCHIGAGTILTPQHLERAIAAGSQFLFSPHTNPTLIAQAIAAAVPMIPGALSPTEIVTAWQAGASCVKIFPIQAVGGANYIKSLQGPLGSIPLIPTGGVTLENASLFLAAGAIAVGLSSQLFPPSLVQGGDWLAISARARQLCQTLRG